MAAERSDADSWLALSPAQRCFPDGLVIAFSHLALFDIVTAARCCKSWFEGAKRVKASSLGAGVDSLHPSASARSARVASKLPNLISSPLRHLVRTVRGNGWNESISSWLYASTRAWTMAELQLLARLPHLTSIQRMILHTPDIAAAVKRRSSALPFPSHLTSVHFDFIGNHQGGALEAFTFVLESLVPCASSLTAVRLTVPERTPCDLSPLLQLAQLRDLTLAGLPLAGHVGASVKLDQLGVIKRLPSLRRLALSYDDKKASSTWLVELCRSPHQLSQLEYLDLSEVVLSADLMGSLARDMTDLTEMEPKGIHADTLHHLAQFNRLCKLKLNLPLKATPEPDINALQFDDLGFLRASWFLPHLSCGASLLRLHLSRCVFSEADAEAMCQLLPGLCSLKLVEVGWPSLYPLRHLTQLSNFSFWTAPHTAFALSMEHLLALTALHSIKLKQIQPDSIDAETVASLKPPSALMPQLAVFLYSPRKH